MDDAAAARIRKARGDKVNSPRILCHEVDFLKDKQLNMTGRLR